MAPADARRSAPFLVVLAALWTAPAVSTLNISPPAPALLDLVATFHLGVWAGGSGETLSGVDAVGVVEDAG
jgi:hypothetical protein